MTGGGWRLLGTVPLVLSDWMIVSTSVFALIGHVVWRVESGNWSSCYFARCSRQSGRGLLNVE
jgi:hypothetical protein